MTNEEIKDITSESLRDWFKKEKWVRISTSGNIAGPCGTSKNKKNPDRCLPKAKAQSLTKAERAATARKKKAAGKKGKTVVANTKKATVKKEGLWANINAKKKAGKKSSHKNSNAYKDAKKAGNALKQETANPQDGKAAPYGSGYKPIKKMKKETKEAPAGHYFTKSGNLVKGRMSADAKERGARKSDPKDKQRSKIPPVTQTREDVRNLVVGLMYEMQNEGEYEEFDGQMGIFQGYVNGIKVYTLEDSSVADVVYYALVDTKGREHIISIDVAGEEVDLDYIKSQAGIKISDKLAQFIFDDINNELDLVYMFGDENAIMEKDDRCTRIAKQKYDTWPSAYASGAVVRCRRGEIWKKK